MNETKTQLELSFETAAPRFGSPSQCQRQRRLARAQWWFGRMHAVVDRAFDWSGGPVAPPEQIYLTLSRAE